MKSLLIEDYAKDMFDELGRELSVEMKKKLNQTEVLVALINGRASALKYISDFDLSQKKLMDRVIQEK